ncbi:MAG TPA: FkbM family methyltransferase [Flavisolibacter sp.]
MRLDRFAGKLFASKYILKSKVQPSFSQAGEDQVLKYLFGCLGIAEPTYLDIGTNHPIFGSNSFYFYNRGSRGVCIEPDPRYAALIRRFRRHDVFLQAGIGFGTETAAELYVFPMEFSGWNTFSKEEAEYRQAKTGVQITEVRKVPLLHINQVMEQYFKPHPNFISLDIEGLDLDVLKSMDFTRFRPEAICVETITFSLTNEERKMQEIIDFVTSQGYFVFADTHVNTIFCNTAVYKPVQP